jgi:molybdate transport system regulatory protein
MNTLAGLETKVRLSVINPTSESSSVFGLGIAKLCQGVREYGSLNAAAKSMGMAYSKAWRVIKDTESALGFALLIRDGAHGSELTDEGNKLLDFYFSIEEEVSQKAMELYKELAK